MSTTNVIITGANRGIGKGFLQRYLLRANHIVVATVRDPTSSSAQALANLPHAKGTRLVVVKMDVTAEADVFNAARELQASHGIDHLDIVVANAGISDIWPSVADLKIADLQRHMEPNVYGMVYTYQAMRPLLQKAAKEPTFVTIGSAAGCMTDQPPFPNAAYGPSKAVVNWLTAKINLEDAWLNAFAFSPGLVETDLGTHGATVCGISKDWWVGLDHACDSMFKIILESSKDKVGGKLVDLEGQDRAW